jgi:uncharacterized protein (TIGR00255 family)
MLKSMTGFGQASVEADGIVWTIEITSVNSRFLDVQLRLPRTLAGTEFSLRKRAVERLSRGKVTVTVTWENLSDKSVGSSLNTGLAESYVEQLRELKNKLKLSGDVSIDVIASLPDIFSSAFESGEKSVRDEKLLSALDEALKNLDDMRATEGGKLAEDINARLGMIRDELKCVEAEAESYARALADRIETKVKALLEEVSIEPQRLAQEAAFLAERADVTEERIRLAAHLDEFEKAVKKGGSVGRRFNFLLQEMVREVNTIGSKTGELTVIQRVVRMKEELEKVREQVQNLE